MPLPISFVTFAFCVGLHESSSLYRFSFSAPFSFSRLICIANDCRFCDLTELYVFVLFDLLGSQLTLSICRRSSVTLTSPHSNGFARALLGQHLPLTEHPYITRATHLHCCRSLKLFPVKVNLCNSFHFKLVTLCFQLADQNYHFKAIAFNQNV